VVPATVPTVVAERAPHRRILEQFGVFEGECTQPISNEGGLDVHRLLRPQRAIVVEDRDTLGAGGMKPGSPGVVADATNAMMLCLAGPSFHEGSGSRGAGVGKANAIVRASTAAGRARRTDR